MSIRIRLEEVGRSSPLEARAFDGSGALEHDSETRVVLRMRLVASDGVDLEAVRHARRSMLREEWTRGREPDEPSLEEAAFTAAEVVWAVRPDQRAWSLQKLEELVRRANHAAAELRRREDFGCGGRPATGSREFSKPGAREPSSRP
jgi:hypothetical protein